MDNDSDIPVVVEVERVVCGHDVKLGAARVAEGPAYVKAHLDQKDLGALCAALAEGGYAFSVRLADRHVSILEYLGASPAEVAAFNKRLNDE